MKRKTLLVVLSLIFVLGAIAVQSYSSSIISLNQPAPFPENM